MNRILFLSLLLLIGSIGKSWGQAHYYYYFNQKIALEPQTDYIFIGTKEGMSFEAQKALLADFPELAPLEKGMCIDNPRTIQAHVRSAHNMRQIEQLIEKLHQRSSILWATPAFTYQGKLLAPLQAFMAKLNPTTSLVTLTQLAEETGCKVVRETGFEEGAYFVHADKFSDGNALEMANHFYETGLFEYTEPDFIFFPTLSPMPEPASSRMAPDDSLYDDQWGLENDGTANGGTSTTDMDIDVEGAWDISMGCSQIRVAVIDTGVDTLHPDLQGRLLTGYDATGGTTNGHISPNQFWREAHGTACAGIVAANTDNGIGVAGIAPNCMIVPIRRFSVNTSTGALIGTASWGPTAINMAINNADADVLSNSWSSAAASSSLTNAINNAANNGRGGLGAIVLFSSGNDNDSVSGSASVANAISIGAMSMCGERKRAGTSSQIASCTSPPTAGSAVSCDGEVCWGSNYGSELDFVLPGVQIPTTDISGNSGYSTTDYAPAFNGTSSSCPHAAGITALVLSVNPNLNEDQVRELLSKSCDKVGAYSYDSYTSKPHGTWNIEMGYGLLNAQRAVERAGDRYIQDQTLSTWYILPLDAPRRVLAGSDVDPTDTQGDVVVTSSATVTFEAGEEVVFHPGFTANEGCSMTARIQLSLPCDPVIFPRLSHGYVLGDEKKEEEVLTETMAINTPLELHWNIYPNPFEESTQIVYELPSEGSVRIYLLDNLGQRVRVLEQNPRKASGSYSLTLERGNLPAGLYHCIIETDLGREQKKIVIQ